MKLLRSCVVRRIETSGLIFVTGLLLLVLFAVVEGPWDSLADWHRSSGQWPFWLGIARWVSRWCDFWPGGLLFCLTVGASGVVLRQRSWQQAALVAIAAALLAGTLTLILKGTLGRARPHVAVTLQIDDGFHGPHWVSEFASFPSGHTTTAFAVAVALAILVPKVGKPALLLAGVIGWSRTYVGAHYLGDVVAGMWIGSYVGWLLAMSFRTWRLWKEEFHDLSLGTVLSLGKTIR